MTSTSSGRDNSALSKELQVQTKARYQRDARRELLGVSNDDGNIVFHKLIVFSRSRVFKQTYYIDVLYLTVDSFMSS